MLIAVLGDNEHYDVYELVGDGSSCPACLLISSRGLSVVKPMHIITEARNYLIQPAGRALGWWCASKPNTPEMCELWSNIVRAFQKAAN